MPDKEEILRQGILRIMSNHRIRQADILPYIKLTYREGHISRAHLNAILHGKNGSRFIGYYNQILQAINVFISESACPEHEVTEADVVLAAVGHEKRIPIKVMA